ncbi:MAG: hypothetical protein ACR2I2_19740 [Bryobacteraceae bacterium]
MATISSNGSVELIALVTNDTDCIPAMKHARRAGLQVALIAVPGYQPAPELLAHSDFQRRPSISLSNHRPSRPPLQNRRGHRLGLAPIP